jgi:hypothetical protein
MSAAVQACSFCGKPAPEVAQLFENEDKNAAVCSECVAMFAANLADNTEVE